MKTIPFDNKHFSDLSEYLHREKVCILPTDTLPGFSCLPTKKAVEITQKLKNRSAKNPFVLLVPDFLAAEKLCDFSEKARVLVNRFWPGPLTLLLPRKKSVLSAYFSHENFLALRIPGDEYLRKFLHILHSPLVSTSVNISGNSPLISLQEIEKIFGKEDIVFAVGDDVKNIKPSTIVRVQGEEIKVVRQGSVYLH